MHYGTSRLSGQRVLDTMVHEEDTSCSPMSVACLSLLLFKTLELHFLMLIRAASLTSGRVPIDINPEHDPIGSRGHDRSLQIFTVWYCRHLRHAYEPQKHLCDGLGQLQWRATLPKSHLYL